jgi:hypothetical protein
MQTITTLSRLDPNIDSNQLVIVPEAPLEVAIMAAAIRPHFARWAKWPIRYHRPDPDGNAIHMACGQLGEVQLDLDQSLQSALSNGAYHAHAPIYWDWPSQLTTMGISPNRALPDRLKIVVYMVTASNHDFDVIWTSASPMVIDGVKGNYSFAFPQLRLPDEWIQQP